MPNAASIKIRTIPPHHTITLSKLFNQALETDFAYFIPTYLQTVRKTNRLSKLGLATIHPKRLVLGLYENNRLSGYSISALQSDGSAYLFWLYIKDDLRGQGLGKKLLLTTIETLRSKNAANIALVTHDQQVFYEHHGFKMEKVLPEYIAGVDMYAMSKRLA